MPRNGTGTYVLPAGQPVVADTVISSTVFNTFTTDIATALTQSVSKDGQTPMTANLPMGNHKITGLATATLAADATTLAQVEAAILTATSVNVMDYGATGLGPSFPDGLAFRDAIDSLPASGGCVYAPKPAVSYSLEADVSDTSNTAVFIPDGVTLIFEPAIGNVVPGADDTVCFRVTGKNGGLWNVSGDNRSTAYTGCSLLRLAPEDEAGTTIHSDIEFNNIGNITGRGFDEFITLKPGPTVTGTDSYLYYNNFYNIDGRNNVRGMWFKSPATSSSNNGPNANRVFGCRLGETGCNTALDISAGTDLEFHSLAIEGVESGSSPSATPTGLIIAASSASVNTDGARFFGLRIEGCTEDYVLENNRAEVYGLFNTGTNSGTYDFAVKINWDAMAGNHLVANTDLVVNKTPPASYRVDVGMTGNGDRFNVEDQGTAANQIISYNIAKDTGPSGYIQFLYGGKNVFAWGGVASAHAGALRVSNPVATGILLLGTNDSDRIEIDASGNMWPVVDNVYSLGKSGKRFTAVWATNGTIQTSDETLKDDVKEIDEAVLRAWSKVNFCQFKWKDEKNDAEKSRIHFGVIAQKIVAAFESEGLNAHDYGVIWKEKDGPYSVSYSQALALECAYLRSILLEQ